jgi:hypothetical protein
MGKNGNDLAAAINAALAAASPAGYRQAVRTVLERKYGADMVTEEMVDSVLEGLQDD